MPFAYKPTLTTINIGTTAPALPESAFAGCEAVETVKLRHDRMSRSILIHIQQCRLLQCHSRRTALLRRKYRSKTPWNKFSTIEELSRKYLQESSQLEQKNPRMKPNYTTSQGAG